MPLTFARGIDGWVLVRKDISGLLKTRQCLKCVIFYPSGAGEWAFSHDTDMITTPTQYFAMTLHTSRHDTDISTQLVITIVV